MAEAASPSSHDQDGGATDFDVQDESLSYPATVNGILTIENGICSPVEKLQVDSLDIDDASTKEVPLDMEAASDNSPLKSNGHANGVLSTTESARPAKRRRLDNALSTTPQKKPISPPWKKATATGLSSFTEDGRRKSGRLHNTPSQSSDPSRNTGGATLLSSHISLPKTSNSLGTGSPKAPQTSQKHPTAPVAIPPQEQGRKTAPRRSVRHQGKGSESSQNRPTSPYPQPNSQSGRTRRSLRHAINATSNQGANPSKTPVEPPPRTSFSRIKLRVRPATIPLVHYLQSKLQTRLGTSLDDYWKLAWRIPLEEGGLLDPDDQVFTDEDAKRDSRLIMQIEKETEAGGILTPERCSVFALQAAEEPPRQYAHLDHVIKASMNMRRLMFAETQKHRTAAKRIAEACQDRWSQRQPKSADQVEAEARDTWAAQYRLTVKTLTGTWDNVRAEINRRRVDEWEAEEQKRVKAALNEAVTISEQKLQARRGVHSFSDEDDVGDLEGDDELENEMLTENTMSDPDSSCDEDDVKKVRGSDDNMSLLDGDDDSDRAQADGIPDDGLTQKQLKRKYAHMSEHDPDVLDSERSVASSHNGHGSPVSEETSDESIDMDDDSGSSGDADTDPGGGPNEPASDEEESMDEQSSDDDESPGTLGLLFGRNELENLQAEAGSPNSTLDPDGPNSMRGPNGAEADVDMTDVFGLEAESKGPESVSTNGVPNGSHDRLTESTGTLPSPRRHSVTARELGTIGLVTDWKTQQRLSTSSDKMEKMDQSSPHPSNYSPRASTHAAHAAVGTEDGDDEKHSFRLADKNLDDIEATGDVVTRQEDEGRRPITQPAVTAIKAPKTLIPFLLRGTLREYQHFGLDWLAGLYENRTNGILADEMGLGKTIQTIALLAHLACRHEIWGPHLVIVPTSVMLNWEMEFKKWCPGFKILAYYGTQEERKRKRQGWTNDDNWNVCVTSYQLVLQDQQVFKRRRWHYMILDEAHNIKNFKSQRWQTLLGFNTHSRLLLTGTPLQNNLTELWSLLFFLMPAENGVGGFADLDEFHDWFRKPESQILESGRERMDDEARALITKLHKVLRPYLLRRLKADVEKQMPAKYQHVEYCRLSKRQRELYDGFLARSDTRAALVSGNYLSIINCLMQLRKVCNHPDLFVDRPILTSFCMRRSVPMAYAETQRTVRRHLLDVDGIKSTINLRFLNLVPASREQMTTTTVDQICQYSAVRVLTELRDTQQTRVEAVGKLDHDLSTVAGNVGLLEASGRRSRLEELRHCVYVNAMRRQERPVYGRNVVEMLTIGVGGGAGRLGPRPKLPKSVTQWFEEEPKFLQTMTLTIDQRAQAMHPVLAKFACVTPAVVARDLTHVLLGGEAGVRAFRREDRRRSRATRLAVPFLLRTEQRPVDPWHEARMRLSIQFPDKRLLQYDCGKLQVLDKLLRRLEAGSHRALIFTQMTKVLDILEQFLNIHGHKYLRLDGATKLEQRQILTDRFNNDSRILCFILSTRSGGLGINLTGADTVIFYDQDWNPAMDKQCQDRCHRIGQTRDVHIYRLVSEHTIEGNILRKASQKQMLDDVVIQEGDFTTDYFNRHSVPDEGEGGSEGGSEGHNAGGGDAAVNAAMERFLGGADGGSKVLEQAEDREDVFAAKVAECEGQADDADFNERPAGAGDGTASVSFSLAATAASSTGARGTPGAGEADDEPDDEPEARVVVDRERNAWGGRLGTIDDYMLALARLQAQGTPVELPRKKSKSKKKGKDTRKR